MLDLSSCVDACLFWPVGRWSWAFFEVVCLNFDGNFRGRLSVWIFEEEVEIGLYLGIGCGLDVIWCHFLLVLAEIRKLTFHVLLL